MKYPDRKLTTKEEAKFYRDKHVIETVGGPDKIKDLSAEEISALNIDKESYDRIMKEGKKKEVSKEINEEYALEKLRESYWIIREIIRTYMDMNEDDELITSLWIIGTYLHKEFNSFPILLINAMKGSGKSRLSHIIERLSFQGKLVNNISESVLFRTASQNTIVLDEVENIDRKEKEVLRGLLQSAYKKGVTVERMKKVNTKEGEDQRVESFELYAPVVIANIFGVNNVLSDRCIPIILERSISEFKTKLLEDFNENPLFLSVKSSLNTVKCRLCSVGAEKKCMSGWNQYVKQVYSYTTTYITLPTLLTLLTPNTTIKIDEATFNLYTQIHQTNINSRQLEIYFPLIIIADMIGKEVLEKLLEIAKKRTKVKLEDDVVESIDVSLYDFISKQDETLRFHTLSSLLYNFREFVQVDEEGNNWLRAEWLSRALKRLGLVNEKRRVGKGVEVMLNVSKAKEKLKIFKKVDEANYKLTKEEEEILKIK